MRTRSDKVLVLEKPEVSEPSHRDLREDLRRIIAEDAERAANEQGEPFVDVVAEEAPVRNRGRVVTLAFLSACLIGIVTLASTR